MLRWHNRIVIYSLRISLYFPCSVLESSLHAVEMGRFTTFAAFWVVISARWAQDFSCLRVSLSRARANGRSLKTVLLDRFDTVFGLVDVPCPGIPQPDSTSLSRSLSREARTQILLLHEGVLRVGGGVLRSMRHFGGMLEIQKYTLYECVETDSNHAHDNMKYAYDELSSADCEVHEKTIALQIHNSAGG